MGFRSLRDLGKVLEERSRRLGNEDAAVWSRVLLSCGSCRAWWPEAIAWFTGIGPMTLHMGLWKGTVCLGQAVTKGLPSDESSRLPLAACRDRRLPWINTPDVCSVPALKR